MKKQNFFFITTLSLIIFTNLGYAQSDWNTRGNSGTNQVTDFIGTRDQQDLIFRTNNSERMRIKNVTDAGYVGINNSNPEAWLDIKGYFSNWIRLSQQYTNAAWFFHNSQSGDFLIGYEDNNHTISWPFAIQTDGITKIEKLQIDGILQIGNVSTPSGYKLYVESGILTEKVKVAVKTGDWADYVFAKDYKIMNLYELEKFIIKNKHLPDVPSAIDVVSNGIDLAKMDALLLAKIEELTLYMIQLKKENDQMKKQIDQLKKQ